MPIKVISLNSNYYSSKFIVKSLNLMDFITIKVVVDWDSYELMDSLTLKAIVVLEYFTTTAII